MYLYIYLMPAEIRSFTFFVLLLRTDITQRHFIATWSRMMMIYMQLPLTSSYCLSKVLASLRLTCWQNALHYCTCLSTKSFQKSSNCYNVHNSTEAIKFCATMQSSTRVDKLYVISEILNVTLTYNDNRQHDKCYWWFLAL